MDNLFGKCLAFTDIHFGKRSDSEKHNLDCVRFMDWVCEIILKEKPDAVLFLGDWFDNRARLRLDTNDYGFLGACQLLDTTKKVGAHVYWLVGNHDMYFKQKRTITSLPGVKRLALYENLTFVDEIMEIGGVLLCPWLVGTEYLTVVESEAEYVFGHFELPTFLMNEQVECPDKGGLHADMFVNCQAVFSGHFHKRQTKLNSNGIPVTYIGNAFPHNFNDVEDRSRGCMVLEWDKDPVYHDFPQAPNYNRTKLSELLEIIEEGKLTDHFNEESVVECYDDLNIAQEEALQVKEILQGILRDFTLKPAPKKLDATSKTEVTKTGKTVDQMVIEHLHSLDTEGSEIDVGMLVDIFKSSDEGI